MSHRLFFYAATLFAALTVSASAVAADNTVSLAAFDKIITSIGGHVYIHPAADYRATLTADEAIQKRIQIRVEGDTLSISCANNCRSLNFERLDIFLPALTELSLHNGGKMTVESGFPAVKSLYVTLHNGGSILAGELISQRATAAVRNGGSITLTACERLDATIRNGGGVQYYGSPKVDGDVVNGGHVRQATGAQPTATCQLIQSLLNEAG